MQNEQFVTVTTSKKAFYEQDGKIVGNPDDEALVNDLRIQINKQTWQNNQKVSANLVAWDDDSYDWENSKIVLIRTPWGYHRESEKFLAWLEKVAAKSTVINDPKLLIWNLNKIYLKELEQKGISVPKTLYILRSEYKGQSLEQIIAGSPLVNQNIVIKPMISADADNCHRITKDQISTEGNEIFNSLIKTHDLLIQEYLEKIKDGEISLVVVDGKFTHSIIKVPSNSDFRVQFQYGGRDEIYLATSQEQQFAIQVLNSISPRPFYGRIDCVYDNQNKLVVQEVEILDPYLRLLMDKSASEFFATQLTSYIQKNKLL